MAETWHVPPWEVEDNTPDIWAERWELLNIERQRANKPQRRDSLI